MRLQSTVLHPKTSSITRLLIDLGPRSWALSYKITSQFDTSAQKYENLRINVFTPHSHLDFGGLAGHSKFRPPQRRRRWAPCTVEFIS